MKVFLIVLLVLAMLATLGTLFMGVFTVGSGGDPRRSNKLMQYRVLLQAGALALFALLILVARG